MKTAGFHWRLMTTLDLIAVETMANAVHPGFFEDMVVFQERQRLYPEGTLFLEIGGRPAGYVLSHPWVQGAVPTLNSSLGAIPETADTYYIHDLALLPEARGSRAAGWIVDRLAGHARAEGFTRMSLVAVNGSQPFWERHGFAVHDDQNLADTLKSYEDSACYMMRAL